MGAIFRSWLQQIKQHRASIEVAGIIFVVVIVFIIIGTGSIGLASMVLIR